MRRHVLRHDLPLDHPGLGQMCDNIMAGSQVAAVGVVLMVFTVGCSPTYRHLQSEDRIPELAALKQTAATLPHRSFRVPVRSGKEYGLRLALHETGRGRRGRVVVLLHGVFSDSRLWRFVRGDLGADHDLLAVDLPGAGRSDDPAPALVGPRGYAPNAMARDVLTALRAYLCQRPSAARVTLVGHSLGSAVILHMLCDGDLRDDFADVLGSVDGVVLLAPVDPAARGDFDGTVFDELADLSDVWVRLADLTGVLKERAAIGARESRVDPGRAVREDADWALEILRDRDRRRALQATLRQADPKVQRTPDAMRKGYAELCVPVLVVTAALDEWSTPAAGRALANSLPHSDVRVIPAAKHSFPLERPNAVSQLIREFIATPVAAICPRPEILRCHHRALRRRQLAALRAPEAVGGRTECPRGRLDERLRDRVHNGRRKVGMCDSLQETGRCLLVHTRSHLKAALPTIGRYR